MATDPHLSDAQIAQQRQRLETVRASTTWADLPEILAWYRSDVAALLDHSEAQRADLLQASVELRDARIFLHGAEQAHREDAERLAQAEAALRIMEADADSRVNRAEHERQMRLCEYRAARAEITVTAHAERIAQLVPLVRAVYEEHRDPDSSDSDCEQIITHVATGPASTESRIAFVDVPCDWCVDAKRALAAMIDPSSPSQTSQEREP